MKADLHCHSQYSVDGKIPVEDLLANAKRIGLGGLAITDHNETRGALKAYGLAKDHGLVVVRAMEISSADGHILAYGVTGPVPRDMPSAETMEAILKLGGIGVAAHPFRWFNGVKMDVLKATKFTAFEACNAHSLSSTNRLVEGLAAKFGRGMTGGSDSHDLRTLGKAVAVFEEDCENEGDIIEAIARRATKVEGTGRSVPSSIGYAAHCVLDWFQRGMKKA